MSLFSRRPRAVFAVLDADPDLGIGGSADVDGLERRARQHRAQRTSAGQEQRSRRRPALLLWSGAVLVLVLIALASRLLLAAGEVTREASTHGKRPPAALPSRHGAGTARVRREAATGATPADASPASLPARERLKPARTVIGGRRGRDRASARPARSVPARAP
ncbi:MAG: hypothetical protein ACYCYN_12615, partial [Solirubrobacteraceae bacterium]